MDMDLEMENSLKKRYIFKSLMLLSLISGLFYFYMNHIDFISSALAYNKMNVSNIGYTFLRMFGGIFLPVVFIVPSMFEYGRIKLARAGFIAYGICHLITASWIIYFLVSKPASDILSQAKVLEFLKEGGFVYSITFWDTYGLLGTVFSIIYGIVAIYTGICIDRDKAIAKMLVLLLFTLRILLPLFSNMLTEGRIFSLFWITNNALQIASQLLFSIAIMIAGSSNYTWIELVWDQLATAENEYTEQ